MDPVELRIDEGVAWIAFGDPQARNLLTLPLLEALPRTLDESAAEARVAVLQGRGRTWSAGYDVARIPPEIFSTDPGTVADHPFERCMRAVRECRLPTVAALRGAVFGGALELAVSCDLRVAHAETTLGLPPARLGLVYSHTGLHQLVRLIGPAHTRMLAFRGRPVDAQEAERIGLVNRVVPDAEFDAAVRQLARDIAACAPLAVQGMKQVLDIVETCQEIPEEELRGILELRHQAYRSEDFREGQRAFQEKRKPRFHGR
ncbi:MAG: enoyl-CoA hydratase/isomerase family protein [Candidatus Latescibacterota bacterium]|nr:MAG: enoyl-CoA hydratase/isomerase family protein [Candidatus Latescibacterota bacterium]